MMNTIDTIASRILAVLTILRPSYRTSNFRHLACSQDSKSIDWTSKRPSRYFISTNKPVIPLCWKNYFFSISRIYFANVCIC